jgi:hypothetical protein
MPAGMPKRDGATGAGGPERRLFASTLEIGLEARLGTALEARFKAGLEDRMSARAVCGWDDRRSGTGAGIPGTPVA